MLPRLRNNAERESTAISPSEKTEISRLKQSKAEKSMQMVQQYGARYEEELALNTKLKALYNNLKDNVNTSLSINEEEEEISKLEKEKKKWETDLQHQAHILNLLISENNKLKEQVNAERNKRAIYFNVYKNLEHQIHHWEIKYKNILIESLKAEGAITKVNEKFAKATKKLEREMQSINQEMQALNRKPTEESKESDDPTGRTTRTNKTKRVLGFTDQCSSGNYLTEIPEQTEKRILSIERKQSRQVQTRFQIDQRSIYLNSMMERIKQISGTSSLEEAKDLWVSIEQQSEQKFTKFRNEEQEQKKLANEISKMKSEIAKIRNLENERNSIKIIPETSAEASYRQLTEKVSKLESDISKKVGINVKELPDDMVLHHCLRVREEKKEGRRNIDKFLEQSKKEKTESSMLLSPQQMHKKIVQSYANAIN